MSAIQSVNQNADVIGQKHALIMNINAAKSLQKVLETNLGPKGTMKMLVSGAGGIKITKDGKVLLDEMQIQHPTAAIIARTATAQDDITGDGTTSNVLFTGELLKQAELYLGEGLHPRVLVEGIEKAREETLLFLDQFKTPVLDADIDTLTQVAQTSLRTKVHPALADHLTQIVVKAVQTLKKEDGLDLHMVEVMHMKHGQASDSRYVDGLVLDHGTRHPGMRKYSENCFILTCNVSLEYERSEVNAGFYYKNAEERQKMVAAERSTVDEKVQAIIDLKNKVCGEQTAEAHADNLNPEEAVALNINDEAAERPDAQKKQPTFIVINQKGIDPLSLDMLQKAGIVALRRAKRRNMERLVRACGGYAVNSVEDLSEDCLGYADKVYEHVLQDEKYTFVEGCKNAESCTILVRGPNDHTIRQVKDALRDGLRAVKNVIEDQALVLGAGCFEVSAHLHLSRKFKATVQGRGKLGVQAFADALLVIPKTLASNSGLDRQTALIELLEEASKGARVGLDVETGKPLLPEKAGIYDCYRVKRQLLHLGSLIAIKLLLVDEVMRAGRKMGGSGGGQ